VLGFTLFSIFAFRQDEGEPKKWKMPRLHLFPALPADYSVPSEAKVELGRYLFYDPILSADSTFSCSSCHQQEYAFSDGNMRYSLGILGTELDRNTPPLFNLAWYEAFFWDGRASSIAHQALSPVPNPIEMGLPWPDAVKRLQRSSFYTALFNKAYGRPLIDSSQITDALAAFQSIIFSQDSKYDRVLRYEDYFSPLEYEGFQIANLQDRGDCLQCHITDAHALGTRGGFSNNGLENASQAEEYSDPGLGQKPNGDFNGWFKIPSLRNLAFTAPYMHDGRFETLDEVLDFYSEGVLQPYNLDTKMQHAHQGGVQLSEHEKKALKAFLLTLTDSVLVRNPDYANPFR